MPGLDILPDCRVGVIVDPAGYIITNEHVVRNARQIRVMLTPKSAEGLAPQARRQELDAVGIGACRNADEDRRDLLGGVVRQARDSAGRPCRRLLTRSSCRPSPGA